MKSIAQNVIAFFYQSAISYIHVYLLVITRHASRFTKDLKNGDSEVNSMHLYHDAIITL